MKRQLTIFMAFVLCFTALLIPASAADATPKTVETVNRISLSDGGYIIEEIIESPVLSRASGTKSGEKISTRYTSDNKAVYAVKVTGTFQYTGHQPRQLIPQQPSMFIWIVHPMSQNLQVTQVTMLLRPGK